MATACSVILAEKGAERVVLWAHEAALAAEIDRHRENRRFLPGVPLPDVVEVTADEATAAADPELCVVAIPSAFLRNTLTRFAGRIDPDCPTVSVVKGIEVDTFLRPSEIIRQVLGCRRVAVLSGPCHAEEVARRLPASVVGASEDERLAALVQTTFTTRRFRVYTNPDLVGTELAGALKNVIAIAAGICDGLGYGDNAKSALMTRGLAEIRRLGVALGARPQTFAGLAGVGDLITTCISPYGRNRRVGERLGRGETLQQILASTESVAEGVPTAKAVHHLAQKVGVEMPITAEVYRVLFEGKPPEQATDSLMTRPLRSED